MKGGITTKARFSPPMHHLLPYGSAILKHNSPAGGRRTPPSTRFHSAATGRVPPAPLSVNQFWVTRPISPCSMNLIQLVFGYSHFYRYLGLQVGRGGCQARVSLCEHVVCMLSGVGASRVLGASSLFFCELDPGYCASCGVVFFLLWL
jgi:hypothetical protein